VKASAAAKATSSPLLPQLLVMSGSKDLVQARASLRAHSMCVSPATIRPPAPHPWGSKVQRRACGSVETRCKRVGAHALKCAHDACVVSTLIYLWGTACHAQKTICWPASTSTGSKPVRTQSRRNV